MSIPTSRMPTPRLLPVVPLCASVALLAACGHRVTEREVVREQPIVQMVQPAPAAVAGALPAQRVIVMQPPPAPQEAVPPPPTAVGQYSWVAGHYSWRDGWQWEPGQWVAGSVRPMPSPYREDPLAVPAPSNSAARWVPGYWEYDGRDWVWQRGRWDSHYGPKGDGTTGAGQLDLPPAAR